MKKAIELHSYLIILFDVEDFYSIRTDRTSVTFQGRWNREKQHKYKKLGVEFEVMNESRDTHGYFDNKDIKVNVILTR